jgi:hypothetical protein
MKIMNIFVVVLSSVIALTSCEKVELHEENGQLLAVGGRTIIVPDEFEVNNVSDSKTFYYYGKDSATSKNSRAAISFRGFAGVFVERDIEVGETNAEDVLTTSVAKITGQSIATPWPDLSAASTFQQITLYDLQTRYSAMLVSYDLVTNADYSVTEVANSLSQILGHHSVSGIPSEMLPESLTGEAVDDEFRILLVAYYFEDITTPENSKAFFNALVIPKSFYENYVTESGRAVNPSNVVERESTFVSSSNEFTAEAGGDKADFLFFVDNSGSMSDEQTAISQVATDFELAISNSGLDYRLATVTTDSTALRDTDVDGGVTTSLTEFKVDLTPGTSGSATESGIFQAERALWSESAGDASDGTLALEAEPLPRTDSSMTIVIMSDETDQYSSYAATTYDPTDNIFVDRGYVTHVITSPYYSSDYESLAVATGGLQADITNLASFNQMMVDIATQAGAAASSFELDDFPVGESIVVKMDGNTVPNSADNGWTNPPGSNKIIFHGSFVPSGGENIEVTYLYAE